MPHLLLLVACLLTLPAAAQTQQVLFPGESGAALRTSLRTAYKPSQLLSESQSKDRLMDPVSRTTRDNEEGVTGLYTNRFVVFDCQPNGCSDSNQDIFNNGSGLNVEHVWPKSEGTRDYPAVVDLHHLYPTDVAVNSDRASRPFAEIPDAQTTSWYRGSEEQSGTPDASEIDEYSEILVQGDFDDGAFEPREAVKGEVARAMFYVATMYDNLDMAWFEPQERTLYDWHQADPISAENQARSERAAQFQQGKPNPFVLDSTLIRRAFFPEISVGAAPSPRSEPAPLTLVGPNPFRTRTAMVLRTSHSGDTQVTVHDALGRRVAVLFDGFLTTAPSRLEWQPDRLPAGVYSVHVEGAVHDTLRLTILR